MIFTNDRYTLALDEADGHITRLEALGKSFVGTELPLLRFKLIRHGKGRIFTSSEAESIAFSPDGCGGAFTYRGFGGIAAAFVASFRLTRRIEWRLAFETDGETLVEWVDFPLIAVPNDLVAAGGSAKLLFDFNEGVEIDDLPLRELSYGSHDAAYPSQGLDPVFPAVVASQFLAYYDDTAGLYFACEDETRAFKGVDFKPIGAEAICPQMRLFPGSTEKAYTLPFPLVFDFFRGDWHDAAELYRAWFDTHLPEGLVRVKDDKTLPAWYTDSPIVVTYPVRGVHDMDVPEPNALFPYENALPYLDKIASRTGARVMALLMHWEGTAPWAPPYVWPPLGGVDLFKRFCDDLHARGFLLGVYCSGLGYTLHSNLNGYSNEEAYRKENLARFMCAPPDGGEPVSDICQAQRKSLDICVSTDFAKQTLREEAAKMASSGLDYIQLLDQNHGGTPYLCYSPRHGHPPIPGGWMQEQMRTLLAGVKKAVGDGVLLGCESAAAEAYIPFLKFSDNRFNLNYRIGRPVPLYAYLYHEYLFNFSGNSVCSLDLVDVRLSPDCFLGRMAHSALAGDLITFVINDKGQIVWSWGERDFSILPDEDDALDFAAALTRARRGAGKDFLVYGRMTKPSKVTCKELSLARRQTPEKPLEHYPAVLSERYIASDGRQAQFFVNYTKEPQTVTAAFGEETAFLCGENGEKTQLGSGDVTFTLPPTAIRMVTF